MVFEWEQVLKDVISEVLETMFFVMVEFQEHVAGGRCFDYESEISLLDHDGSLSISLQVSQKFAGMITANFLGMEENQVKDDDLKDSLRELANMIGGAYNAHIGGADRQLGLPGAWKVQPGSTCTARAGLRLAFDYFGEPAGSAVLNYLPEKTGQLFEMNRLGNGK